MSHIIDIIEAAVNELHSQYPIDSIVDNADNTYTVTLLEVQNTSLFSDIKENEVVTIAGTVGFIGDYLISNVDENTLSFTIAQIAGTAIPGILGAVTKKAPYYYPEYIVGLNEHLTRKNLNALLQWQKFPLFYLSMDFDETKRGNTTNIKGLVIYIINTTEQNRDVPWRHINSMPYLRSLELRFFESLTEKCNSIGREYIRKELFYGKPNKNLSNAIVDSIKLTININF